MIVSRGNTHEKKLYCTIVSLIDFSMFSDGFSNIQIIYSKRGNSKPVGVKIKYLQTSPLQIADLRWKRERYGTLRNVPYRFLLNIFADCAPCITKDMACLMWHRMKKNRRQRYGEKEKLKERKHIVDNAIKTALEYV